MVWYKMKKIGTVYKTTSGDNTCPDCGKKNYADTYLRWPNGKNILKIASEVSKDKGEHKTIRVIICDCGNVMVRQNEQTV